MICKDLVIIGAGPAGMSAAVTARRNGIDDILLLERNDKLGGILEQCIHSGFGLHMFKEELTGPEYAFRYEKMVNELGIKYKLSTMVTDITKERVITAFNDRDGLITIKAKAVILAMGCRERSRGSLNIPGTRPAGIFTAGTAQRYVNINGYMPGKEIVILGSGDIGLIMARRMTLEGGHISAVCELMPYSGGLTRNIVQCLEDFGIPLYLSHTVTKIHGKKRVEGVTISEVDTQRQPIEGTEMFIPCDTLLLSVGLIPENELSKKAGIKLDKNTSGPVVDQSRQTSVPGIFACGNVLHVHDLVDYVSEEAETAGAAAAKFIRDQKNENDSERIIEVRAGYGVKYTVPQMIEPGENVRIFFRVTDIFNNVSISVSDGEKPIFSVKRIKCAPGEMESIMLPSHSMEEMSGSEITVSIIKE